MPAPVIAAIIAGGAGLGAAGIQAHSAGSAARRETDAANHAADLQSRSAHEALTFQEQQAGLDRQTAEANRHANYDQWAARERRIGTIGDMVGLNPREIPGYVPLPNAPTAGQPGAPAGPNANAGPVTMPNGIDPRLAALYQKYGVTPGERGSGLQDWQYWQNDAVKNASGDWGYVTGRLEADLQGKGMDSHGSAPKTASASPYTAGSVGSYLSPSYQPATTARTLVTPALQMPDPYRVGSVGSYL